MTKYDVHKGISNRTHLHPVSLWLASMLKLRILIHEKYFSDADTHNKLAHSEELPFWSEMCI